MLNNTFSEVGGNITSPVFTFTVGDGTLLVGQLIPLSLSILLLVLFCIFRKEKEFRYRGVLPYFSIFGVWLLMIRFSLTLSFLMVSNKNSFTYKLSCWFDLLANFPVLLFLLSLQSLNILQYLINKRIHYLKGKSYKLLNESNKKVINRLKEKLIRSNLGKNTKVAAEDTIYIVQEDDLFSNTSSIGSSMSSPISSKHNSFRSSRSLDKVIELDEIVTDSSCVPSTIETMDVEKEDEAEMKKFTTKIKIARFIASNYFKFITLIIICVSTFLLQLSLVGGIEIVTKISSGNYCTFENTPIAHAISSLSTPVVFVAVALINILIMILDRIHFLKQNGCWSSQKFYVHDDPFGFRLEQTILMISLVIYGIPFSLIPMIIYFINSHLGTPDISTTEGEVSATTISIVLCTAEMVVLITTTSVSLLLALFSYIKKKLHEKRFEREFELFIATKDGFEILRKYSKREWSLENVLFYEDVLRYQNLNSAKYSRKRAVQILENYVLKNSPLEVELSASVRRSTKEKVETFVEYKNYHKTIFNDAIFEVKFNMEDTFSRITSLPEYKQWKTTWKATVEKLEESDEEDEEVVERI
eukprot:gene6414-10421_t